MTCDGCCLDSTWAQKEVLRQWHRLANGTAFAGN